MEKSRLLKYVGGFVILAIVFLLGISVGRNYKPAEVLAPTDKDQTAGERTLGTASLMIDYGNGKVAAYQDLPLSSASQTKVFDLLKSAADKNNIALGYKDYGGDMGVFVESIGGVGKDPAGKKWWQYWVNNTYSQVGVSGYVVQPGDSVELKFIQGQI